MKRIVVGTLIGTIIFFGFQTCMWMGGFNKDISLYSTQQDSILTDLAKYNLKEGLYMLPSVDPNTKDYEKACEESMKSRIGKPWAMVFYHPSMHDMDASYIINGILYTLIACLIASMMLYNGRFQGFSSRFLVSMAFAVFTLAQGVLDDMNWWGYPWPFVRAQVIDLTVGWGLCSLWLAFYVKNISRS